MTQDLMEQVVERDNLNRAFKRVKANEGAPGVDGMTVGQLSAWAMTRKETLIAVLLDGSYRPQPVKGVQIPKPGGGLGIAPQSIERMKDKVRRITRCNRGVKLSQMIEELNSLTMGWVTYFRHAAAKGHLQRLDEWIREKLRWDRLKQCKRARGIGRFLRERGLGHDAAWCLAGSGKGWWRMTHSPQAHMAMGIQWWEDQGLQSLRKRYLALQSIGNRRIR